MGRVMRLLGFSVLFLISFDASSCCIHLNDPEAVFKKNISNKRVEDVQWLPPLSTKVVTTIGIDAYYSYARDFDESTKNFQRLEPTRTKRTMLGLPFKPREFFEKPMDEQIKYLKNAILKCDLPNIIDKRRKPPIVNGSFEKYIADPYPEKLEILFEQLVWKDLGGKYDIPFDDFQASLREALRPEDALYSAPLISYYAPKLAPRYECHYTPVLNKVIKLPSEFELSIGAKDEGVVVYERKE